VRSAQFAVRRKGGEGPFEVSGTHVAVRNENDL